MSIHTLSLCQLGLTVFVPTQFSAACASAKHHLVSQTNASVRERRITLLDLLVLGCILASCPLAVLFCAATSRSRSLLTLFLTLLLLHSLLLINLCAGTTRLRSSRVFILGLMDQQRIELSESRQCVPCLCLLICLFSFRVPFEAWTEKKEKKQGQGNCVPAWLCACLV